MQDSIEHSLVVANPIGHVWQALTEQQQFGQWFGAKVAEPFTVDANVSCTSTYSGYEHLTWEMLILFMDENERFAFNWNAYYGHDSDRDGSIDPPLTVIFELEEKGNGTLIKFAEVGFTKLPEGYRATARRINVGGWAQQIKKLEAHFVTQ